MKKLMIASKNKGKIKEYIDLLKPFDIDVVSYLDFENIDDVIENGNSFYENAMIKAKHASIISNLPCIADDSGLEVFELNNAPGIYSKRYSMSGSDLDNNELLLKNMDHIENRVARFVCVIIFYEPLSGFHPYYGEVKGTILRQKRGTMGFGYDPLFYIDILNKTMAECSVEEKNRYSHRAIAMNKLLDDFMEGKYENYTL
jgi:XTP/dITP diphosphohydrolase